MNRTWIKDKTVLVRMNAKEIEWLDKLVAADRYPYSCSRSSVILALIEAAVRKLEAKPE